MDDVKENETRSWMKKNDCSFYLEKSMTKKKFLDDAEKEDQRVIQMIRKENLNNCS